VKVATVGRVATAGISVAANVECTTNLEEMDHNLLWKQKLGYKIARLRSGMEGAFNAVMNRVTSSQLRNETRRVLARVEAGEEIVITVDGRDVALLGQLPGRRRWVNGPAFLEQIARLQADAGLTGGQARLLPDTTDDLDTLCTAS